MQNRRSASVESSLSWRAENDWTSWTTMSPLRTEAITGGKILNFFTSLVVFPAFTTLYTLIACFPTYRKSKFRSHWTEARILPPPKNGLSNAFVMCCHLNITNYLRNWNLLDRSREEGRESHVLTYEPVEEIDLEFTRFDHLFHWYFVFNKQWQLFFLGRW